MLDQWAEPYERGQWAAGKTVILGRPKLANDDTKSVTFKMPNSLVAAIDAMVLQDGSTRSDFLREAVVEKLQKAVAV
jgi:hypothetical protein